MDIVFSIDEETGEMTFLVNEVTKDLVPEAQEPRRASNVEPEDIRLRLAFRALRMGLGDESRVAEWTRTWDCKWLVDLRPVGGHVQWPFTSRAEAINWEINWLNENML